MLDRVAGCIDVETTGLSPYYDEIAELAIVLFSYDDFGIIEVLDSYSGLREPGCDISEDAFQLHGLSKQDLFGKRLDFVRISEMVKRADFLVAHNASFDRSFLKSLFPGIENKLWHCSMSGIRWRGSRSLQSLFNKHKVSEEQNHRALDDAMGLISLLSKKNDEGKTFFSELIGSKVITVNSQVEVSNKINALKGKKKSGSIDVFKRDTFIMSMPSNEEIKIALLRAINDEGGEIKPKEAYFIVRNSFPKFASVYNDNCTPSEKVYWESQIKIARKNLVIEKCIEKDSPVGIWRITDKGRNMLNVTLPR
jgi:DNA polymerase III subunit epsilon